MTLTHRLGGGVVALAAIVAALLMLRTAPDTASRAASSPMSEPSTRQRAETRDHARTPRSEKADRRNDNTTSPHPPFTFPMEMAQVLRSQPERLDRLETAFKRWYRTRPELAAKLMGLLAERFGAVPEEGAESVWTQAEIHQAMSLVLELKEVEDRLPMLSELGTLLATADPAGALQYLDSFEKIAEKEQFIGEVMDGWTRTDPTGATEWAREEPSGPHREMMLERIVQTLVQEHPAQAAKIVAEEFESPEVQATALRTVVGRWVHTDPAAAGKWLASFPATQLRSEMLDLLIASWRSRDAKAADAWIRMNPTSEK